MEARFQVDYQTIDQTRRMIIRAPDKSTAENRSRDVLFRKHGDVFSILRIEQIEGEHPWEQIADYVMKGNSYRLNCKSEKEAIEIEEKITQEFGRRLVPDLCWTLRFGKAVHVFRVRYVGLKEWKELNGNNSERVGRYGYR